MFDLVIRGGTLVNADGTRRGTIAVAEGRVAAIAAPGESLPAHETIDAEGLLVLPGLVDAHVHFREPGLVRKEGFLTGTLAAAAGGVTSAMVMPTDNPFTLTPDDFAAKCELADGQCHVDVALQAGLGPDLRHVRALSELGAVSFEIFLADLPAPLLIADTADLLAALRAVEEAGSIAGITPGDDSLVGPLSRKFQAERPADRLGFFHARPPIAEAASVAKACLAVRETAARAHIRQVSCAASVDVLRALRPPTLSTEVTPHNLLLDEGEILRQGPTAKVAPPLRQPRDLDALRAALREGRIDMVATDHAPHLPAEKDAGDTDIWKAPGGFPGVQTFLPLMLGLVAEGLLSLPELVRACCEQPARRFGLYPRKGVLQPGADADLVIVDPARPFTIRDEDQLSKAKRTPFHGRTVKGMPVLALLRGAVIMRDGRPEGPPRGRFVAPNR